MSRSQLRAHFSRHVEAATLDFALDVLLAGGLITTQTFPTGGRRPPRRKLVVDEPFDTGRGAVCVGPGDLIVIERNPVSPDADDIPSRLAAACSRNRPAPTG